MEGTHWESTVATKGYGAYGYKSQVNAVSGHVLTRKRSWSILGFGALLSTSDIRPMDLRYSTMCRHTARWV